MMRRLGCTVAAAILSLTPLDSVREVRVAAYVVSFLIVAASFWLSRSSRNLPRSEVTQGGECWVAGAQVAWGVTALQGWRSSMEDAFAVHTNGTERLVAGVFDGHGGPTVAQWLAQKLPGLLAAQAADSARVAGVFADLDAELRQEAKGREFDEQGSTACVLVVEPIKRGPSSRMSSAPASRMGSPRGPPPPPPPTARISVANCGDCRAVLARNNRVMRLSTDHNPGRSDERARIVAAGGYVKKNGPSHLMDHSLAVSRSFGDFSFKQGAGGPELQKLSAEPDVTAVALDMSKDEFAIIASDGVWGVLSNEAAVALVRACFTKGMSAEDASKALAQRCVAPEEEEGGDGQDNVTAVVVRFLPLPGSRSPSTSTAASSA